MKAPAASVPPWRTAWVAQLERRLAATVVKPDVVASTLERAAEGVVGLA